MFGILFATPLCPDYGIGLSSNLKVAPFSCSIHQLTLTPSSSVALVAPSHGQRHLQSLHHYTHFTRVCGRTVSG